MSVSDASRYLTPEAKARVDIDAMLTAAGWVIQNRDELNLSASRGVAVREFLMNGNTEVDYLLFVDGQAVGAYEAKKAGTPLTGVESQTAKYAAGPPDHVPAPIRPLPFRYEGTGIETFFTNTLDPEPRSREVFSIHRPEPLARWIADAAKDPAHPTFRARLHDLPDLDASALWTIAVVGSAPLPAWEPSRGGQWSCEGPSRAAGTTATPSGLRYAFVPVVTSTASRGSSPILPASHFR